MPTYPPIFSVTGTKIHGIARASVVRNHSDNLRCIIQGCDVYYIRLLLPERYNVPKRHVHYAFCRNCHVTRLARQRHAFYFTVDFRSGLTPNLVVKA